MNRRIVWLLAAACSAGVPAAAVSPEARFAIIGDYGDPSQPGQPVADVANMVAGWSPEFVVTVGDNNYVFGQASTIDPNIGAYYSNFIGNYQGVYGPGSAINRFFPSLGNHDWESGALPLGCQPYLDYFT